MYKLNIWAKLPQTLSRKNKNLEGNLQKKKKKNRQVKRSCTIKPKLVHKIKPFSRNYNRLGEKKEEIFDSQICSTFPSFLSFSSCEAAISSSNLGDFSKAISI